MWKIRFKDDNKLYGENTFHYMWDNVPQNKTIEEIRFRLLGKRYTFNNFDKCSIHRKGTHPFGSHPRFLGYVIYLIRGNAVEEITTVLKNIKKTNIPQELSSKYYDVQELNRIGARPEHFRNGTGVVSE